MKEFHLCLLMNGRTLGNAAAVCLSLITAPAWGYTLAGDEVQGSLILPWAPDVGNWFSLDTNQRPISSLPTSAIVGPGVEFGYYKQTSPTAMWSVTADLSGNRIIINDSYSDSNPGSIWLFEMSSFTLTLSDLDSGGVTCISGVTVVSQDPHISLLGYDAHSIQFHIDAIDVYPVGPYAYSRTTTVDLALVPEPSGAALLLCGAGAAFWRSRRGGRADKKTGRVNRP